MCVWEREREQRFCKRGIIIPFFSWVCVHMYVYVWAHWGWLAAETVSFVVCIIGNINEPHFLHYFVLVYRPFSLDLFFPLMWSFSGTCNVLCVFWFSFFISFLQYIFFGTFSPFYQDVKRIITLPSGETAQFSPVQDVRPRKPHSFWEKNCHKVSFV